MNFRKIKGGTGKEPKIGQTVGKFVRYGLPCSRRTLPAPPWLAWSAPEAAPPGPLEGGAGGGLGDSVEQTL